MGQWFLICIDVALMMNINRNVKGAVIIELVSREPLLSSTWLLCPIKIPITWKMAVTVPNYYNRPDMFIVI